MSKQRLRIVTFNIAHGRGLHPIQGFATGRSIRYNLLHIARMLHRVGADVVALQEIDQESSWAGNFDHGDYLSRHSGIAHTAWGINNHRRGFFNLRYGNALLSRFPILSSENVVFGQRTVGEKGFLFTEIDFHGKVIPLVNLHLHYRSRSERLRQLDHLTAWLTECFQERAAHWHIPPIVCGDFNNCRSVSDATALLHDHLHDYADYHCFPTGEKTFPSPWPSRALDYVFIPEQCHHAQARVIRTMLSDHRPVLVEFDV